MGQRDGDVLFLLALPFCWRNTELLFKQLGNFAGLSMAIKRLFAKDQLVVNSDFKAAPF